MYIYVDKYYGKGGKMEQSTEGGNKVGKCTDSRKKNGQVNLTEGMRLEFVFWNKVKGFCQENIWARSIPDRSTNKRKYPQVRKFLEYLGTIKESSVAGAREKGGD